MLWPISWIGAKKNDISLMKQGTQPAKWSSTMLPSVLEINAFDDDI